MPQRILDSHHHLWDYDPTDYPWIDPDSILARDYGFDDLKQQAEGCHREATIVVQARQSLKETDWLLGIAKDHPLCVGVVGWVPLMDAGIGDVLARYADEPMLKGVRHVIQDEPDPAFMLQPEFLRGLEALSTTNLRYDLLIFGHQLPNSIKMVDHVPNLPIVLDHIAKPVIDPAKFDRDWAENISRLAERSNVCCKLSGMVTEVRGESWNIETLRPYVEHVIACFGAGRLMFGSDWPVCRLRAEYTEWVALVRELVGSMSAGEQDGFWYQNAAVFYGVEQL